MIVGEGGGGREKGGGEGVDPGIGCPFFGSWMGAKLGFDIRDPELG
jgi:hypothetical protein